MPLAAFARILLYRLQRTTTGHTWHFKLCTRRILPLISLHKQLLLLQVCSLRKAKAAITDIGDAILLWDCWSSVTAGPASSFIILLQCLGHSAKLLYNPFSNIGLVKWTPHCHTQLHLMTHFWTWLSNNVNSPWFCERARGSSRAVWFKRNSRYFFPGQLISVLVCAPQLN